MHCSRNLMCASQCVQKVISPLKIVARTSLLLALKIKTKEAIGTLLLISTPQYP